MIPVVGMGRISKAGVARRLPFEFEEVSKRRRSSTLGRLTATSKRVTRRSSGRV